MTVSTHPHLGLREVVLEHNQEFLEAHQRLRDAVGPAVALVTPASVTSGSTPVDEALQSNARRTFERIFEPLTREEPQQAKALLVVAGYLILLRLGSPDMAYASEVDQEPARQPDGEDVSSMHALLFGYRPCDREARWCLPTRETMEDDDSYDDFIDFLQYKQVGRMHTTFAAAIAHLRLCPDPHATLSALEDLSLANWLVPYEEPSPSRRDVARML